MTETPASGRKLFFGLFIFPLLIAVGMAVLLCGVVLLTHEQETPESLVAAIKTGAPGKRWQKAFELSNELSAKKNSLRSESLLAEIVSILKDSERYDAKTRGYMAIALSHFSSAAAIQALRNSLKDPNPEIKLYSLWSLGALRAKEASADVLPLLNNDSPDLREMSAYTLGQMGDTAAVPHLLPLLKEGSADLRWNAALSLARLGSDAGYPVILEMLQREKLVGEFKMPEADIENLMINATKGLALIPGQDTIKILRDLSKNDKSLKVRQAALNAIEYKGTHGQ